MFGTYFYRFAVQITIYIYKLLCRKNKQGSHLGHKLMQRFFFHEIYKFLCQNTKSSHTKILVLIIHSGKYYDLRTNCCQSTLLGFGPCRIAMTIESKPLCTVFWT